MSTSVQTPVAALQTPVPASWTAERRTTYVNTLIAEFNKGNATSTGFKPTAWTSIANTFNAAARVQYTKQVYLMLIHIIS